MVDELDMFSDEDAFSFEDDLESSFFVYKTLIEEGQTEKVAMEKAGLTKEQIKDLYEKELQQEFGDVDDLEVDDDAFKNEGEESDHDDDDY